MLDIATRTNYFGNHIWQPSIHSNNLRKETAACDKIMKSQWNKPKLVTVFFVDQYYF